MAVDLRLWLSIEAAILPSWLISLSSATKRHELARQCPLHRHRSVAALRETFDQSSRSSIIQRT